MPEKKSKSESNGSVNQTIADKCKVNGETNCGHNSGNTLVLNHERGRSAFSPYRPSTVLTNLQRGNIQTQTPTNWPERTIHELAAMGELFVQSLDGVVIDELDDQGFSPLLWAASYGQLTTVKLLISKGADINICGKHGETALLLSVANGHIHVLKELINNGVNINDTDEDGNSGLMFAAFGNHALCANELLKAGADITVENSFLDTAFTIAIKKKSKQVQLILEKHILQLFN
ncbi:ankyrin repeat family A protein 2-like [Oppia nitens]|uniref:ankyrin repeat family A protein 2-like n=1 Tax=Oppia nitens TaxID=1686743 RepID=UPI0023DCBBBB|nr:ankyrin repeat family A protein 2-like [Oppia nitens]XP_054159519.1 ankyrin repeat family A protein 2-like [Oppia nitens]